MTLHGCAEKSYHHDFAKYLTIMQNFITKSCIFTAALCVTFFKTVFVLIYRHILQAIAETPKAESWQASQRETQKSVKDFFTSPRKVLGCICNAI